MVNLLQARPEHRPGPRVTQAGFGALRHGDCAGSGAPALMTMRFVTAVTASRRGGLALQRPSPRPVQALTSGEQAVRKCRDGPARSTLAPGLRIRHGCGHRSAGAVQRRCPGGRHHTAHAGPSRTQCRGRGSLANQLAREWPSVAVCLVSFFMIGIIWVNHHAVLHNVARVDRTEMFDSLLLLILVTAIPFSTAILARYLHRGSRHAHPAAAIDGLPVLGVALSFTALCAWAARRGLLHAGVPGRGAASSVRLSPLGRSRSRRRSVWRS